MRTTSVRILVASSLLFLGCSGAADEEASVPANETGASGDGSADSAVADDTSAPTSDSTPGDGAVTDVASDSVVPLPGSTDANLKVAFVGDQGATTNTINVMKLIRSEGAQFVVILGDFDYGDNPDLWDSNLTKGLGADFPVFAAAGNHDVLKWPDYKKKLEARLAKITGAKCAGDYGNKMACTYHGLFFVLSGVGTMGVRTDHEAYLEDQLTTDKSIWRVCAWHKNQHDMQTGDKGDEVGWKAYQLCQNHGALVMTGHEHSYERTKTLNALGDRAKGHGALGAFDRLVVKAGAPGNTFVTVSGLGGVGIRDFQEAQHADDTWWATWYAIDGHLKNGKVLTTPSGYGATFVTFNVDGDPKKARGYFKNVAGVEIDTYEVQRE